MVDITRLRIDNITTDGYYFDDGNVFFKISDEDILRLRRYYNDPTLAYRRKIVVKKEISNNKRKQRKYSLDRSNKFNNGKNRVNGIIAKNGQLVIVGGVLVSMVFFSNVFATDVKVNDSVNKEIVMEDSFEDNELLVEGPFDPEKMIMAYAINEASSQRDSDQKEVVNISVDYQNSFQGDMSNNIQVEDVATFKRQEIIRKYCNIYSVNYDIVYKKIVELTEDFTSDEYLNDFTITGVMCKSSQVYAENEEVLLLLTIRHIKQIPTDFNLTEEQVISFRNGLEETREYNEDGNVVLNKQVYLNNISYFASLFDLDRCLLKAIIQSECGFDSLQFNEKHNPAGLRSGNGEFRSFDSDLEGLIEFCTEMVKYYKMGAETFADIRDIHAPLTDGNNYWLDNVTECYFETVENEEKYFGSVSTQENSRRY